jgi:nitrite reductase (NADH) large subunit
VQQVLDIYGDGMGCEVCKPALSYLVDVIWCGDHEEDRSARFINDRVTPTSSATAHSPLSRACAAAVTTPAELRRIADVAEKYEVKARSKSLAASASTCSA